MKFGFYTKKHLYWKYRFKVASQYLFNFFMLNKTVFYLTIYLILKMDQNFLFKKSRWFLENLDKIFKKNVCNPVKRITKTLGI